MENIFELWLCLIKRENEEFYEVKVITYASPMLEDEGYLVFNNKKIIDKLKKIKIDEDKEYIAELTDEISNIAHDKTSPVEFIQKCAFKEEDHIDAGVLKVHMGLVQENVISVFYKSMEHIEKPREIIKQLLEIKK